MKPTTTAALTLKREILPLLLILLLIAPFGGSCQEVTGGEGVVTPKDKLPSSSSSSSSSCLGGPCDPTLCRGPWSYIENSKTGTCCRPNVGDKCRECRQTGVCKKCQRHYMLKDGKCYKKCRCRRKKSDLNQQCCPRCVFPCKKGLECIQRGRNNVCLKPPTTEGGGEEEKEYEYDFTEAPSYQPTAQPSK
jgi:hypothetical protein